MRRQSAAHCTPTHHPRLCPARAEHITMLHKRVNELEAAAGLPETVWAVPSVGSGRRSVMGDSSSVMSGDTGKAPPTQVRRSSRVANHAVSYIDILKEDAPGNQGDDDGDEDNASPDDDDESAEDGPGSKGTSSAGTASQPRRPVDQRAVAAGSSDSSPAGSHPVTGAAAVPGVPQSPGLPPAPVPASGLRSGSPAGPSRGVTFAPGGPEAHQAPNPGQRWPGPYMPYYDTASHFNPSAPPPYGLRATPWQVPQSRVYSEWDAPGVYGSRAAANMPLSDVSSVGRPHPYASRLPMDVDVHRLPPHPGYAGGAPPYGSALDLRHMDVAAMHASQPGNMLYAPSGAHRPLGTQPPPYLPQYAMLDMPARAAAAAAAAASKQSPGHGSMPTSIPHTGLHAQGLPAFPDARTAAAALANAEDLLALSKSVPRVAPDATVSGSKRKLLDTEHATVPPSRRASTPAQPLDEPSSSQQASSFESHPTTSTLSSHPANVE